MNGILGMVDPLVSSELTLDQKRTVRTVKQSSNALVRVMDDVLDLPKLEATKLELWMDLHNCYRFWKVQLTAFGPMLLQKML